ncbi:Uncharacterized protein RNJ44_04071 [Nakaseomyces bracarensis]|uniref:Uncharacterized protein n=1 Tax=Nakaseomyces bracarensis TaxID=273131 RepID=A0ABR4NTV2_9SACH
MDILSHYQSFVNPSKVRALVVPVGKWKRKEFLNAFKQFCNNSEVRLLDITPIDCPLFTPQGFPNGRIFFDFTVINHADALDLFLYDFEPFRKIFVIIGLVKGDMDPTEAMTVLKEKYHTVISHNLVYASEIESESSSYSEISENVFQTNDRKMDNIETIICDIARNFLTALNHYYSSYKHVTLRSPGAIGGNAVIKTTLLGPSFHNNASINSQTLTAANTNNNASKRLSSFEVTTNNLKRSASLKLSTSLTNTDNKTQNRAQGRQLKILGNFQLLAGRVLDALSSFTEAIILLYKVRDLLWLGSALDGVAICFVILSYLQTPFKIPYIVSLLCPVDSSNNSSEIITPRNSTNLNIQSPRNSLNASTMQQSLEVDSLNLPLLIKAITEKTLHYYENSLSHNSEYAPQLVYTETLSRILSFMICCHSTNILSNTDALRIINCDMDQENKSGNETFTSTDIYQFSTRFFQLLLKDMDLEVQASIYSLLSKTFEILGLYRKQAFILRLLLVAINNYNNKISWHPNFDLLLNKIIELYNLDDQRTTYDSKAVEWKELKKDVLQLCLSICKKVGDKEHLQKFSLLLLNDYNTFLAVGYEKQLYQDYMEVLLKEKAITQYWDPFLLRAISISRLESENSTTYDTLKIPNDSTAKSNLNPQEVFNPFKQAQSLSLKNSKGSGSSPKLFLVDDRAEFSCTIQNPYEFGITITDLQFPKNYLDYCEIDNRSITANNPYIIDGNSIRTITLPVWIKSSTAEEMLKITRLDISVLGLPILPYKILPLAISHLPIHPNMENILKYSSFKEESLNIKILPEQPDLEVIDNGKSAGNSWMMLDGTKSQFKILLRNKSLSKKIDQLKITAVTNIEHSLRNDYWKKMLPDDLHIFESNLEWLKNECIKVIQKPDVIEPNEVFELTLEINTIRVPFEFDSFVINIDYGMQEADKSCFYMKKLKIPYEVTLRRSIEVPNMDIIPLNQMQFEDDNNSDWIRYIKNITENSQSSLSDDYMLLLIDFRNSWIDGINLVISYEDFSTKKKLVESNRTLRVIIPIKKIDCSKENLACKPIPRVFKYRQFLQSGLKEDQEAEMREGFWCREHILERIKCTWEFSTDSSVKGEVDFRKYLEKFDPRIVGNFYKGKYPFSMKLYSEQQKSTVGKSIKIGCKILPMNLVSKSKNYDSDKTAILHFFILEYPSSKLLPRSNKRLLYNGSLSQIFSTNSETNNILELIPIEPGCYEICCCISKSGDTNKTIQFNSNSLLIQVSEDI